MDTIEAIRQVVSRTGKSNRAVSELMGRSPGFINSVIEQSKRKGGGVNSSTLANVANACGCKLAFVPRESLPDDAIVIDPPG